MKKQIIPIISTLVFALIYFYLVLPPLNIQAMAFWSFIIMVLIFYVIISSISSLSVILTKYSNIKNYADIRETKVQSKKVKIIFSGITLIICGILIVNLISSPMFSSSKYASRITVDETHDFNTDIAEVDFNKIPLLDKESTQKLGDRKMGEFKEFVSQYYVSDLYTQINYNEEIVRVTPLEYDGIFKYFSNKDEGIKGYITVDSVNGDAKVNELDKGMKYMSSAYFSEDLYRKLRFTYPTEIFGTETFEIDEEGNPYWIVPTIDYAAVNLRADIDGIIILDAVTGESKKYELDEVPSWVDHVYMSDLIINQIDNWGTYQDGFINSLFGQKGVVNTTDGYNYITMDDDVYLYTGITSVASDQSNLGFVLVNLRTKETNYYSVSGAEEFSAMSSAEGLVQEKGYVASFPLLINLNSRPTYLLSLKDAAGLVKMYAFVDVEDYQIVSTTDSSKGIDEAASEYLNKVDIDYVGELLSKEIRVTSINTAVIDGNTYYYLTDENSDKYQISIKVDEQKIPFIGINNILSISYQDGDVKVIKSIN